MSVCFCSDVLRACIWKARTRPPMMIQRGWREDAEGTILVKAKKFNANLSGELQGLFSNHDVIIKVYFEFLLQLLSVESHLLMKYVLKRNVIRFDW